MARVAVLTDAESLEQDLCATAIRCEPGSFLPHPRCRHLGHATRRAIVPANKVRLSQLAPDILAVDCHCCSSARLRSEGAEVGGCITVQDVVHALDWKSTIGSVRGQHPDRDLRSFDAN